MRNSISNIAEYGGFTRGARIITNETKEVMKEILKEIQTNQFSKEWITENERKQTFLKEMRKKGEEHPVETTGKRLRSMMSWEREIIEKT